MKAFYFAVGVLGAFLSGVAVVLLWYLFGLTPRNLQREVLVAFCGFVAAVGTSLAFITWDAES